jgi:hypothetical protein
MPVDGSRTSSWIGCSVDGLGNWLDCGPPMVEMAFAAREYLLARSPEPRSDRRWNRSLAQQVLHTRCAGCCFVTDGINGGGLHCVCAGRPHVAADSGQAQSLS